MRDAGGAGGAGGDAAATATGDAAEALWLDRTRACGRYFRAWCEARARCSPAEAANLQGCLLGAHRCPEVFFGPGSMRDIDSMLACADDLSTLACVDLSAGTACSVPGTRATGEACAGGAQCASESCALEAGLCGRCEDVAEKDGSCSPNGPRCRSGLACNEQGRCVARSSVGLDEACNYGGVDCAAGVCSPNGSTLTCRLPPRPGESCTSQICDRAYCGMDHACHEFPALGAACGQSLTGDACADDAWCDQGACAARVAQGEACDASRPQCAIGLQCGDADGRSTQSVCFTWRTPGESCTEPGAFCLFGWCTSGTCDPGSYSPTLENACSNK